MLECIINQTIENYAYNKTKPESLLLQELITETSNNFQNIRMISDRIVCGLLKMLVTVSAAKFVLEIGTFTGYSALSMAEALPEDGKLVTVDNNPKALEIAQKYFDRSPHGKKIQIIMEDGLEAIKKINDPLDFVFIDADKANYLAYYQAVFPLVKLGGVIVFDNALWSGKVIEPKDLSSKIIAELNEIIVEDTRSDNVLLTVRDGVNIVYKKSL